MKTIIKKPITKQNCIVCRNPYEPVKKSWYCQDCKKPSQFGRASIAKKRV